MTTATKEGTTILFDDIGARPRVWVKGKDHWMETSITEIAVGREFGYQGRLITTRLLELPADEVAPNQRFRWHNHWYQRGKIGDREYALRLHDNNPFGKPDHSGHAMPTIVNVLVLKFQDLGPADHP